MTPRWNKKLGSYGDQYRDTPYEGTNAMPDNGDEDLTADEIEKLERDAEIDNENRVFEQMRDQGRI